MACTIRIICVGMTLLYLTSQASSTTWLYNAPRALFGLAGSASASASAPSTPVSVIADLRRKEIKSAQLQEDKGLDTGSVGLEPLSEENDDQKSTSDEANNEVSPSLLKKKIGKVLAKLRLIAQIKNAYHYRPEVHEHDTNITISSLENSDNSTEFQSSTPNQKKNETNEASSTESFIKTQSQNIQHIPLSPSVSYGSSIVFPKKQVENVPTKISLEVNQINDKLQQEFNESQDEEPKVHEPSRLGALGVFFAELVGSIVGLTYGAVAQITSGGQSPVTISTSEGL